MLRLELHIVTQSLNLLSAAMRMLGLGLVFERLIFFLSLLPQCIKKYSRFTTILWLWIQKQSLMWLIYKSYNSWLLASSLSNHSGSTETECLCRSTQDFPFVLFHLRPQGRSVYFSSLSLIPAGLSRSSDNGTGPQVTLDRVEAQDTLSYAGSRTVMKWNFTHPLDWWLSMITAYTL